MNLTEAINNATNDSLVNSSVVNRLIGESNSYDTILTILNGLGYEPVSLLGHDYTYIFDTVRRLYRNDKFTFYGAKPNIHIADIDLDSQNLKSWVKTFTGNTSLENNVEAIYSESDDDTTQNRAITTSVMNAGSSNGGLYESFNGRVSAMTENDLLKKTNDNFTAGAYRTLIGRFHTNSTDSKSTDNPIQTAISKKYGMSHGRNLLKTDTTTSYGYDNPYCRVWTYHHQYHRLLDTIRPMVEGDTNAVALQHDFDKGTVNGVQPNYLAFRTDSTVSDKTTSFQTGGGSLDKYGVLDKHNGLPNIVPLAKVADYKNGADSKNAEVKNCMFSLENLAWKGTFVNGSSKEFDDNGLSPEQKGPFGGRIMWFPPYNIEFNENVNVNWADASFIGRGEKIYTYSDTERDGGLSFDLLIDHPAILDYWEKRDDRAGQTTKDESQGDSGVDDINSNEQKLLRFFAGCEVLKAGKFREPLPPAETPKVDEPVSPSVNVVAEPQKQRLLCFVYFPNNYSGLSDAPTTNSVVNAMDYLMRGVGTQCFRSEAASASTESTDMAVDVFSDYGKGYEMITPRSLGTISSTERSLNGISIFSHNLSPITSKNIIKSKGLLYDVESGSYVDYRYRQSHIANEDSVSGYYDDYGPETYWATVMAGSKAVTNTKDIQNWEHRRWWYRVDKTDDVMNQVLKNTDGKKWVDNFNSYLDVQNHNLNGSMGYQYVQSDGLLSSFNLENQENDHLVSFADLYVGCKQQEDPYYNVFYKNDIVDENVQLVRDVIVDKKYNITSVTIQGHASIKGDNPTDSINDKRNEALAKQRARTLKLWVKPYLGDDVNKVLISQTSLQGTSAEEADYTDDNSDRKTKEWRSAVLIIEYEQRDTESAQDGGSLALAGAVVSGTSGDSESSAATSGLTSEDMTYIQMVKANYGATEATAMIAEYESMTLEQRALARQKAEKAKTAGDKTNVTTAAQAAKEWRNYPRYDNEGEFFNRISVDEPILKEKIKDKIKYFNPAFHSITPEGFNSRLTFLQQCCRQGSTIGGSDVNQTNRTANNLAFGRAPVCVLRLGDFFNTKIIITSMSIKYDKGQWDLNEEGIGVMPMIASVSLQFKFIGGSSMAGPIARLQNAVSFNYYANTEVYDNRAEQVIYDNNGKVAYFKPFEVNYLTSPYNSEESDVQLADEVTDANETSVVNSSGSSTEKTANLDGTEPTATIPEKSAAAQKSITANTQMNFYVEDNFAETISPEDTYTVEFCWPSNVQWTSFKSQSSNTEVVYSASTADNVWGRSTLYRYSIAKARYEMNGKISGYYTVNSTNNILVLLTDGSVYERDSTASWKAYTKNPYNTGEYTAYSSPHLVDIGNSLLEYAVPGKLN